MGSYGDYDPHSAENETDWPEPLPEWTAACNGAGKRSWFLVRGTGVDFDRVPVSQRYFYGASGQLVRYASCQSAQRAADVLNAAERAPEYQPDEEPPDDWAGYADDEWEPDPSWEDALSGG
jgi:hypothetical protein